MRIELRRLSALSLLIALVGVGCSTGDDEARPPQLGVKGDDEQAAEKLGFPSSATRNTVRVGGGDPASDAAGVAGALYPATGDSDRPTAVVLVDQDDWVTGVAAAMLSGRPIGAPILLASSTASLFGAWEQRSPGRPRCSPCRSRCGSSPSASG